MGNLLSHFAPAPLAVDRDRLMFLAGRAEALAEVATSKPIPAPLHVWPWLTLLSTAAAVVMAVLLWQQPSERVIVVERPATEKTPAVDEKEARPVAPKIQPSNISTAQAEAAPVNAASWDSTQANYVLWRERVLREGVDALAQVEPSGTGGVAKPATQRELLQEFYGPAARQPSHPSPRTEWWNQWLNPGDRS
jgi:hypothetical protein